MPPADTNETRNFEVQDSYAFFDAGASKKKVIVVCAGFLPSHLSLTDYFRSADLNRKIVENPPPEFFAAPPSNDCLVILSDDALAHCVSGETAFAVFLTDPVNRLISEFCLMANISTTPMPFGG